MLQRVASSSTITRRLQDGRLLPALPGVYVVAGAPPSIAQRWWLGLLAPSPDAVLSFETSARMHGISTVAADGPPLLTVRHSGWQRLPEVVVHPINALSPAHLPHREGLPVTPIPRTLL